MYKRQKLFGIGLREAAVKLAEDFGLDVYKRQFQDRVFESFEEFQTAIIIDNKNILQLEKPLEILRAGIIDNEPMLKTPWGDKRLADKAVNK